MHDSIHVGRTHRERGGKGIAVCADCPIDFVAGEHEEPAREPMGPPPRYKGEASGGAFIPAELTLDRPEVFDPGFDFDDEQCARSRIECEEVDPAVASRVDDLDLPADLPASAAETAVDVPRAPGVNEVMLRPRDDQWLARGKIELDAEPFGDPRDEVERRIRAAGLDSGDIRSRDAHRIGQGLLGDIEHGPRVEAEARKRDSEMRWHGAQ